MTAARPGKAAPRPAAPRPAALTPMRAASELRPASRPRQRSPPGDRAPVGRPEAPTLGKPGSVARSAGGWGSASSTGSLPARALTPRPPVAQPRYARPSVPGRGGGSPRVAPAPAGRGDPAGCGGPCRSPNRHPGATRVCCLLRGLPTRLASRGPGKGRRWRRGTWGAAFTLSSPEVDKGRMRGRGLGRGPGSPHLQRVDSAGNGT